MPCSILIATKLYSPEPGAGAILCINRQSVSRGTSKRPQAQKVLPIIVRLVVYTEVIGVCIIGLVYTEDLQISLVSLPFPCPDGRSGTQREQHRSRQIPTPHLASLEGQSIEFNSRHLLSKANRIWALASCEVTSKAKNGDAVQKTTWMIDILRNTVYKNQAQHLLDKHLLKKRWPFHLWLIKCLLDQIAVLIHTLLWI